MFSSKLTRVANRATAPALTTTTTSTCTAGHQPAQSLATRPSHQRRPSSSKTSCPPDSSKPAPAAKATTATATASTSDTPSNASPTSVAPAGHAPRRSKRSNKVRIQGPMTERMGKDKLAAHQYAALPSVPDVQHLNKRDVGLSSFFSMHRPLSVTTTIPRPTTTDAFNAIFEATHHRDPWADGDSAQGKPEDVIYTLHNTIESLESSSSAAQDEGVRWEILHESPSNNDGGIKHLDAPPKPKTLDEIVAMFKPFQEPPPPQSFLAPATSTAVRSKKATPELIKPVQARPSARQPTTKSYQTTITVHEVTETNGRKSYRASSTPIRRMPDESTDESLTTLTTSTLKDAGAGAGVVRLPVTHSLHPQHHHYPRGVLQPFRTRMRRRAQLYLLGQERNTGQMGEQGRIRRDQFVRRAPSGSGRPTRMLLISVKRQRKLKMKKHKYKKLMKRTRNLRRRLDRN